MYYQVVHRHCIANNDMLEHLQALLAEYPMIDTRAMGFPQNWQDEPLWSTQS